MSRTVNLSAIVIASLAIVCAGLTGLNLYLRMPDGMPVAALFFSDPDMTAQVLLHNTLLPRIVVALMTGTTLGLVGAVLQNILRNPLAEPATLGISAGSYLLLAITTLWFPQWAGAQEWVAFAGAALSLLAILALSWRKGLSPVTVTLAGMIVSLYCGAASAVLVLFNRDFLVSIFLWGAGYLDQQDWSAVTFLAPRLAVLVLAVALLLRPLTIMTLEDANARSLGLSLAAYRLMTLVVAAALIAVVTASVGIISFIGLAAPALARACGARRMAAQLVHSSALGALLLTLTDQIVLFFPVTYRLFPTAAVTALLGAPLMFTLIRRLKMPAPPQPGAQPMAARLARPMPVLLGLLVVLCLAAVVALFVGKSTEGWFLSGLSDAHSLGWRWPRALAAFSGGAMLALAGAILQRVTGNPMASPEVLGVSSGAMLGVIAVLLTLAAPSRSAQILAGAAGSLAVLLLMLTLSRKPGFSGDRLLLIGIALSSVSGFVMAVLMTSQDPRLGQLLAWLSGSTYAIAPGEAIMAIVLLSGGLALVPFIRRWLEVLPLGEDIAKNTGVSIVASRNSLYSLSAVLTASATILVGPLSFAGLMGPHLARLAGFQRAGTQLPAAALIGGLILLIADWLGRNLIFPFQIPAGLLATVVGGPFLLILIGRRT